jgi:hypothetical protein
MQVAAVATARKLAVLCWHLIIKDEDYTFALPSLIAHKQRKLELRAGAPPARGRKGAAARYSLAAVRAAERDLAAQGEAAYPHHRRRLAAVADAVGLSSRDAVRCLPDRCNPSQPAATASR